MTVRCAQCAWDNFLKTRDVKQAIKLAGTSGGFVWNGTSLCENHFGKELINMDRQVALRAAQQEAEKLAAEKARAEQPAETPPAASTGATTEASVVAA